MTVATLDLDGFKDVNDTLGHPVGDRLLQEVARRLTSVSDKTRVYRLGEDEFVLLMENCGDPLVAGEIVETILKRLTTQFDLDGTRYSSPPVWALRLRQPMVRTSICWRMPTSRSMTQKRRAGDPLSRPCVPGQTSP
jgi:GGDEF domain-containing protein